MITWFNFWSNIWEECARLRRIWFRGFGKWPWKCCFGAFRGFQRSESDVLVNVALHSSCASVMLPWAAACCRSFQELDAHSVYHLLPTITQPVLIVSGFFDVLTPPMQSVEIARRIPQAVHYCDPWSSHASILESPEWTLAEIEEFVYKNNLLQNKKTEWTNQLNNLTNKKHNKWISTIRQQGCQSLI